LLIVARPTLLKRLPRQVPVAKRPFLPSDGAMVMILPFVIGLLAALLAMRGQRFGAILAWAALIIVLLAWLQYHASDTLNVSL
jgi:hypothetical protein